MIAEIVIQNREVIAFLLGFLLGGGITLFIGWVASNSDQ